MTVHCFYCGHELKKFGELRTFVQKGDRYIACADLDACKARVQLREVAARNRDAAEMPAQTAPLVATSTKRDRYGLAGKTTRHKLRHSTTPKKACPSTRAGEGATRSQPRAGGRESGPQMGLV